MLERFLTRLEELGIEYHMDWRGEASFSCPAHDDRSPSCGAREGDDGKLLVNCLAGCSVQDVVEAIGWTMRDLFPEPRVVAEYVYTDEAGKPYIKVERWEPGEDGEGKFFKQYRWDEELLKWVTGVSELDWRPLYNLPAVESADHVWLVEGEKDADRLMTEVPEGDAPTTGIGGAQMWRHEWTEALRGKHVIMVPDEDNAGLARMDRVRKELEGVAASFTVRRVAHGKDISDHLNAGLGLDDLRNGQGLSDMFATMTWENLAPRREYLYEPFIFERALTWLWGPSGHGKSIILDYAMAELSKQGIAVLLYDWEAPELELERLQRMEADPSFLHVRVQRAEAPSHFGTEGFAAAVAQDIEETGAKLVVFNTFTAMYSEHAAADSWNAPVREAGTIARALVIDLNVAVVVTDHQEDPTAIKAHGGSTKKAWSDLYLRVTQDGPDWRPGQKYYLKIENLKPSREYMPVVHAMVYDDLWDRLKIHWTAGHQDVGAGMHDPGSSASAPEEPARVAVSPPVVSAPTPVAGVGVQEASTVDAAEPTPAAPMSVKERAALMRLKEALGAEEVAT